MTQLRTFVIRRILQPLALLPFPPSNIIVPAVQAGYMQELMPIDMMRSLIERGQHLEELCLDWWAIGPAELELLLKAIPNIRKLEVAVKASMLSIVGLMLKVI